MLASRRPWADRKYRYQGLRAGEGTRGRGGGKPLLWRVVATLPVATLPVAALARALEGEGL